MGASFTWREYRRVVECLGLEPTGKGTQGYKGIDRRTKQFRYTQVHEHPGEIDARTLQRPSIRPEQMKRHPSIVVGRLQYEREIPAQNLNGLHVKIKQHLVGQIDC